MYRIHINRFTLMMCERGIENNTPISESRLRHAVFHLRTSGEQNAKKKEENVNTLTRTNTYIPLHACKYKATIKEASSFARITKNDKNGRSVDGR